MWRKGNPFALMEGMQTGAATVESSMEIPQKIKNGSVFWPGYPISGNISKETQNTSLKEYKHAYVHCNIIYNHQDTEAAQVSISRWVDKQLWGIHRMEYYLAPKNKKILSFLTVWMDLENIMLCEISQLEKDKYHMISLKCRT